MLTDIDSAEQDAPVDRAVPRVLEDLTEAEACLAAILLDDSGVDIAEFSFVDESSPDGCYRLWPMQWPWFRCPDGRQIDMCGRSVGKSEGCKNRAGAFGFNMPGEELVITTPEGIHADTLTDRIEAQFLSTRLLHEMVVGGRSGITHRPFKIRLKTGARIIGRIPQKSGVGLKGCMAAGTLVLAKRGLVPIESLVEGDEVYTHKRRWRPVLRVDSFVAESSFEVSGTGAAPLVVSASHAFLVRENEAGPKEARRLSARRTWIDAGSLGATDAFWASPAVFADVPEVPLPWRTDNVSTPVPMTRDLWWIVGRYLMSGWVTSEKAGGRRIRHRMFLTIADDEVADVSEIICESLGLHVSLRKKNRNSTMLETSSGVLGRWLEQHFGSGPASKRLPPFTLGIARDARQALLDGYMSGGGTPKRGGWIGSSASKNLTVGMKLLAQSVGQPALISVLQPKVDAICGNPLKAKPALAWKLSLPSKSGLVAEDGYFWGKVRSSLPTAPAVVYNPVIDEDHSYIGDGIVCHNTHPAVLEIDECFPATTFVLCKQGQVPINDVKVGDLVWTHAQRWRPVTAVMDRGIRPTIEIRGHGHPGLVCTPDHRFYARDCTFTDKIHRHGPRPSGPDWIVAKDLADAMWASPASINRVLPPPHIPRAKAGPRNANRPITLPMMWVFGLWLAEGSVSRSAPVFEPNKATWSIHTEEVDEVVRRLRLAGLSPWVSDLQTSENGKNVVVGDAEMARLLSAEFRTGAYNKQIPPWVYALDEDHRRAVLEGLVYGDGFMDKDPRYAPGRWKLTTVSKALAVSARLLGLSLGYSVSVHYTEDRKTPSYIRGREVQSGPSYQVVGGLEGQGFLENGMRWTRVREIVEGDDEHVYDLEVADDHSFVADGFVVHNCQDFPEGGWREVKETLKRDLVGARWRCHGVTTGIPNEFQKLTQPEVPMTIRPYKSQAGFTVHRITAYHKPTWTDAELEAKLAEYGSRNTPEFRRNVLGLPGDIASPILNSQRLLHGTDTNQGSNYNLEEYWKKEIRFEQIVDLADRHGLGQEDHGRLIVDMLDFPEIHKRKYQVFWAGMDVGIARDPSEVLVFAEYEPKAPERRQDERNGIAVPLEGDTRLKLVTRLNLLRFPTTVQAEALMKVVSFYHPRAFAMDSTGNGLGLLQQLQQLSHRSRLMKIEIVDADEPAEPRQSVAQAEQALTVIKGYNFGGKVVVEIDEDKAAALPANTTPEELAEKAGIKRLVKEWATEVVRGLVDVGRLMVPYDENLLAQMNGQTWSYSSEPVDAFGNRRRVYSRGEFHAFDALRMGLLGHALQPIEQLLKAPPKKRAPVYDRFL